LPLDLKQKLDAIFSHEKSCANFVAATVIRPKPLSVWEVLIPVIFILGFMKSRQERDLFSQNLMFTKKTALEAAYKMVRDGRTVENVMADIDEKTQELVAATPESIYSEKIRREQLKEIRLLIDHYCRLLHAEGADFNALVTGAYPTPASYSRFLKQLATTEAQVSAAAKQTLGARADTGTLAKIETALDDMRNREAKEIYASG
jgi:hypothetical protein